MLVIADNIDLALKNVEKPAPEETHKPFVTLYEGMEMTQKTITTVRNKFVFFSERKVLSQAFFGLRNRQRSLFSCFLLRLSKSLICRKLNPWASSLMSTSTKFFFKCPERKVRNQWFFFSVQSSGKFYIDLFCVSLRRRTWYDQKCCS